MRFEKSEIQISCVSQFLVLGHELEKLRSGHHAKFANELLRYRKSEPGSKLQAPSPPRRLPDNPDTDST